MCSCCRCRVWQKSCKNVKLSTVRTLKSHHVQYNTVQEYVDGSISHLAPFVRHGHGVDGGRVPIGVLL